MAFSGRKPWLAQTPDEILAAYNATEVAQQQQLLGSNQYGILKLKFFIFYKDVILLMRGGNAWGVPHLTWTTGNGGQTCILKQIVAGLKRGNLPPDLLNELQFADLGHIHPEAATNRSSLPNTSSEVTIFNVLTTTHPAMEDVADQEDFDPSPGTRFRWVPKNGIDSVNLGVSLTKLHIDQARQRLVSSNKTNLSVRWNNLERGKFCSCMIGVILQTRAILQGVSDLGNGIIAVSEEFEESKRYLKLFGTSLQHSEAVTYGETVGYRYGQRVEQVERLLVVGRWRGEIVEWVERFGGWESVIDVKGRLREGNGVEWP